jgi:regulator of protease activity HflC (stomatin/prohibitin superfamily)
LPERHGADPVASGIARQGLREARTMEVTMTKHILRLTAQIAENQRGLLRRDGKFERLLEPGRHVLLDPLKRLAVDIIDVVGTELPADRLSVFEKAHPDFVAQNLEVVRTGAGEVAIVTQDGQPRHFVAPLQTRAFWTCVTRVEVELIDVKASLAVAPRHLDQLDLTRSPVVALAIVEAHEVGLLFVDGVLVEELAPGRHAFWQVGRTVRIAKVDLRPQPVEITAQEILTRDRIALRVTLTAFHRVTDARKLAAATNDLATTLYRLVQFAVREAIATRALDDILAARAAIDAEIKAYVRERIAAFGVEITELGIKDVILPGEVRELLNKVVEAERVAKANLIRRQEETAATRSLLNTARLMEDNPLLVRLKELEALEKLVEKVGRIDLHTSGQGAGLEALLQNLYRLGRAPAEEAAGPAERPR